MYSVKGKVCLVTGGSRGIGMMIAKGFVENGAKVYVASRKKEVCDQVAAELNKIGPGTAVGIAANLTSDEACKALATEIGNVEDKLDVLVNNAGATWGDHLMIFQRQHGKEYLLLMFTVFGINPCIYTNVEKSI